MRLRNIKGAREEIASNPYVVQDPRAQRGQWRTLWNSPAPIHIEIGMGKGRFITTLAQNHPEIHYVGMERYSSVLLRGLQKMENSPLDNIRFICDDATYLTEMFAEHEISKIYLNFSDPWPKDRHAKRRLTSNRFLPMYDQVLSLDGTLEFKTDNADLFAFSLESIEEAGWNLDVVTWDLHQNPVLNEGNIMTEYEEKFSAKGNPIHKLIASRNH